MYVPADAALESLWAEMETIRSGIGGARSVNTMVAFGTGAVPVAGGSASCVTRPDTVSKGCRVKSATGVLRRSMALDCSAP